MSEMDPCTNCGKPKLVWLLLCPACVEAKEKAYAECRALGITDYIEILGRRAEALAQERNA